MKHEMFNGMRTSAIALLITCGLGHAHGQLTVSPQTDLQELARSITGPGVSISNPVINCHSEGYGAFTYSGSALGISEGILLTSGRITETIGPNNVENKSFQQQTNGNPLLDVVTGRSTRDACLFEFDIIPSGDSLRFNFTLGSEEYNEWVGSQYNDVFGFFISGPGIAGDPNIGNDHNIALIPSTNLPVTINNVNNGSNSSYYFDNAGGQDIQYDGLTRGLFAESVVQPCQNYHLKLVVADASDRKFDSGVFIERIQSNPVQMTSQTVNGTSHMVEGCNPGWVTFTRQNPLPTSLDLFYYLQGSAINGTDYVAIGNTNPNVVKTVTIPANQTSVSVNVDPVADAILEPMEELHFILGNPLCPALNLDTLIFTLNDTIIATVSPVSSTICAGDSVQFDIDGGESYVWSPATGLSSATSGSPWAKPLTTTDYTVTINEGVCSRTVDLQIQVSNPQLTAVITRPLCSGEANGAINLSHIGAIAPYTYSWTGPNGFTASTEDLVNIPSGNYTLVFTDGPGCQRTQTFNVGSPAALGGTLSPSILPLGENVACFGGTTGSLGLNIIGGTAPYTSNWTGPNGFTSTNVNLTGLRAGTYQVNLTDANSCSFTASYTMTQPTAIGPTIDGVEHLSCFGVNEGEATVNIAGGTPPFSIAWNTTPVQTSADAINLPVGTAQATVTDGYGCASSASVMITGPAAALSTSLTNTTPASCFSTSTGSATVSASGGTTPYTYSWNTTPIQTGATASNLPAGTWICTVSDANSCSTTRSATISQPSAALSTAVIAQMNVTCFGASTGSASISITGGTAPYTSSWNTTPSQTGTTVTNLPAGTWTCAISDARGCATTRQVTITQPSAGLTTSVSAQTNVNCFGASTGSATVAASGGTGPYTFSWNTTPIRTGAAANALPAGTWTCTVTDANGCSSTQAVNITQPATALGSTISAQTNVSCHGGSTGSASVAATGGTAPYAFSWNTSPAQTSASAAGLAAGTWTCTITDSNSCTTTQQVIITQPTAALSSSISSKTNVSCFGNATGSATIGASGGTGPYSFSWNTTPTQNGATATNLSAGIWICTVTDSNGCTTMQNVSITQPSAALSASVTTRTNVTCFGASTGSVTVLATGGTAPYTYTWNTTPVQNGTSATGLAAGNWICSITDANGCATSLNVMIAQPAATINTSVSTQTNVSCFAGNTGNATVLATGGTAPYVYSWNTTPVQSSAQAVNLNAGLWTCSVSDANGCSTTQQVNIAQPTSPLSASTGSQTNVGCFGGNTGTATVTANGGTAPYTFSWNTTPTQNSATATQLTAGTWTCTVSDAQGCSTTRNVTITQPAATLSAALSTQGNVNCFGSATGHATVSVSGGSSPYSYSWNTVPIQTTPTASALSAGTWICTISDANGCETTRTTTITQPSQALQAISGTQTEVSCFGAATGSATMSATGGTAPYSFSWNTSPPQPNATANNLTAGNWTCTISDARGCVTSGAITITQPTAPLAITGVTAAATCGGAANGAVDANVIGGTAPYTNSWSGPNGFTSSNTDITNIPAGVYTLSVSDALGCTSVRNFDVGQPGLFTVSGTTSDHNGFEVSCPTSTDGSITQSVSGGTQPYSHAWTGPGSFTASTQDISGLVPGTYMYVVTDDNGCSSSVEYELNAPALIVATQSSPNVLGGWNISCNGIDDGSITMSITGGVAPIDVQWNGPDGFVGTTANIGQLIAGTYTAQLTDANNCVVNSSITLTQPQTLSANNSVVDDVACFGGQNGIAQVVTSGGTEPYSYAWNTTPVQNTANAVDLPVGNWTCSITDANGCSVASVIEMTGPSTALSVAFSGVTDVLCFNAQEGSATATASGGTTPYEYAWDTAPVQSTTLATNLPAGDHTVTVTDARGCQTTNTVTVAQPLESIAAFFDQVQHVSCFGASDGAATISLTGGSGSYVIAWDTNPVINGATATGLAPGLYTVDVMDANGCSDTKNFPVTIQGASAPLEFDIVASSISCFNAFDGSIDLTITGGQGPYSHIWTDGNGQSTGLEDIVELDPNTFSLQLTDFFGCTRDTIVTITEPTELTSSGIITTAACQGSTDGAVDLSIAGGTPNYSVQWSGPNGYVSTMVDIAGIGAGVYTMTATDANGCERVENFNIGQPGSLQVLTTASVFNGGWGVSCLGATDGTIDLDITGGAGPYTVAWSGPNSFASTNEDLQGLAAGSYSAVVTDNNGCALSAQVSLTPPEALAWTVTTSNFNGSAISCANASDGSIEIIASGGSAPYGVLWTGPDASTHTTAAITDLGPGTYNALVTDANGCTLNATETITEPTVIDLALSTTTSPSGDQIACAGAANGAIDLTIAGGAAPYTVVWTDGVGAPISTEDLSDLSAGVYNVVVTDANGCTATDTRILSAPLPIEHTAVLSEINGSNVTCNGAFDGSIDLTVTGGAAPYTFSWSNGADTEDLAAITAGTYDVEIVDVNGCTINASYTLEAPASVVASVVGNVGPSGSNVLCAGAFDGALEATITGGTTPYSITWSGPNGFTSNASSITELFAGNYDLAVTDANGCMHTSSTTVTEPAPVQVVLSTVTYGGGYNIPCSTISIGLFNTSVTGGTPGYDYTWNGPDGFVSTDPNPISLSAGNYEVFVNDANGCTGSATATLTSPGELDVVLEFSDFNGLPISCAGNDGSASVVVSGGAPAYTFDWSGPDGFSSQQSNVSSLWPGTYSLSVHDANGCSLDTVITLDAAAPLQASFSNIANLCAGEASGAIDLSITGGGAPYTFSWSGPDGFTSPDEDLSGLVSGLYTVTVSDEMNCDASFTTTVLAPAAITSGAYTSFFGQYNLQCQNDSTGVIDLAPAGGVPTYSVSISGPGGFSSSNLENTGLVAGDYAILITDLNGCVLDTMITLTEPQNGVSAELDLSVYASGTNVSCYGASDGWIDATITGGTGPYVFSWRGPDSLEFLTEDVTNLPAGDYAYELVVTDANQCSFFTTVTLTEPDTALWTSTVTSVFNGAGTTCSDATDGSIDLTVGGGNGSYSFQWNGPNGFSAQTEDITTLAGGTYTATVTDLNGCIVDEVVELTAPEPLSPQLDALLFAGGTAISCNGANDASISASIFGGTGPFNLAWSGPNGFNATTEEVDQLAEGTYCLDVTDANGCAANACVTVLAPATINASTTSENAACGATNGTVDLTVSGGSAPYSYTWDNGAASEDLAGLEPGDYEVTVSDVNGCIATLSVEVEGSPALEGAATSVAVDCYDGSNGSIDLQVSAGTLPFSFEWSNGGNTEDLSQLIAGEYEVTVTDAAGCTFLGTYSVVQPVAITIDAEVYTYTNGYNVSGYGAQDGSIITFVEGGTVPYSYTWSNGSNEVDITGLAAGTYTLEVTDANGCISILSETLTEANDLTMPTGFSPNGDGANDFFDIRGIDGYSKNLFTVLNRWGNVVYEQPNYSNQWSGENSQGEILPDGTYFVILSINDGTRTLQGYVDLRR